jgi:hypothetical protein
LTLMSLSVRKDCDQWMCINLVNNSSSFFRIRQDHLNY